MNMFLVMCGTRNKLCKVKSVLSKLNLMEPTDLNSNLDHSHEHLSYPGRETKSDRFEPLGLTWLGALELGYHH